MESNDIIAAIYRNASTSGSSVALMSGRVEMTYEGFLVGIRAVHRTLRSKGVKAGDRVGILAQNSPAYVVAMYGIMHAGCTFVSLPVRNPTERLTRIREAANLALVLSDGTQAIDAGSVIEMNDFVTSPGPEHGVLPPEANDHIAYVIFTSGSTGEPKGVCISRRSLSHAVHEAGARMRFSSQTRSLAILPLQFDGSFSSVFPVLTVGGMVYINEGPICLPKVFCVTFERERLTHTTCTPTYLRILLESSDWSPQTCRTWRTLAIGGEDLEKTTLRQLKAQCPQVTVYNRYGPTESTMAVTTHEVTDAALASPEKLPIGAPHEAVEFIALNGDNAVIRAGEAGELYIGGAQLMEGYLNDPIATRAVVNSEFFPGKILYRTGDVVTVNADGLYVYLGRADNVVKRDGNRISLEEIESACQAIPGVAKCACVVLHTNGGTKIVAAVEVMEPGLDERTVRRRLLERLPANMSPDRIEIIDSLPSSDRGKIDRAELRRRYASYAP